MNLTQMAIDVEKVNRDNRWFDSDRTRDDDIALLHTEISEAFDAYREHGFEDATVTHDENGLVWVNPKPEGVGSELADVLIRFLDTAKRYDWDLAQIAALAGNPVPPSSFAAAINELHHLAAIMGYNPDTAEQEVAARFYALLRWTADEIAGVILEAEYIRKLAYNRTRGARHGGKLV